MKYRLFLLLILFLAVSMKPGEQQYPKNYFRSPVGYPISLAGSFGEIRRNHFHSGIDIRTAGVQGKPIYAIADGYVSRVNIAPGGFGKALYISHPNGYTSLYAHLRNFEGPIARWIRDQQYQKESFAMDVEVAPGILKVKKGDIVAWSGNSGASGGPHLHFEIRDSKTQEIIDPFDFGFMKSDGIPPKIAWIKVYPHGDNAMVNYSDRPVLLPAAGTKGVYKVRMADTLKVSGDIIFGIETSDAAEGGLKTGVHSIELWVDGVKVFGQTMDRFQFADTRYVNSLIDYPAFVTNMRKIQRSYVAPNNRLNLYHDVKDRGVVHFGTAGTHKIRYVVSDAFGNKAVLEFPVKSHPPAGRGGQPARSERGEMVSYKADNHIVKPGLKFDLPAEAVYEEYPFQYSVSPAVPGSYGPVHHLQDRFTPIHTWSTLSLKPEGLPKSLESKALIVQVAPGNKFTARGGTFADGWITTRIRDYGNFTVAVDQQPPAIKAVNIFPGKKVKKQSSILMKISDNLSGVKTYRGTLNGRWILMDYDEKNRLLTYVFDDRMKPGSNRFELTVTDATGNTARYEASLVR